jgi:hypothetical protein
MKVDLPDGSIAQLRESVTLGQRNTLQQVHSELVKNILAQYGTFPAWNEADSESWGADLKRQMQEWHKTGVLTLLESWTRDEELPTIDTIDECDPALFDAILDQAAPLMIKAVRGEQFGPSGQRDPKADTGGSPDSDASSGTAASPRSTSRTKKP